MNKGPQQIKVEINDKEAEGIYSNLAMINHNPTEFFIDFARFLPPTPKAKVYARIIMTPTHAKMLQKTLSDNIEKYEKQFGEIKMQGLPQQASHPIGFNSPEENKEPEN